jgi:curved DNA-binding protein CbpA
VSPSAGRHGGKNSPKEYTQSGIAEPEAELKNYYEILEVSNDASQEDIRKQYRLLIHAWHPDKFPRPDQKIRAEDKLKKINEAYAILGNAEKRSSYDNQKRVPSSGGFAQNEGNPHIFRLTLQPTYYRTGFFNVTVEYDRFVRRSEGSVQLILGNNEQIQGKINRTANLNGTARVYGGGELRRWFQDHHDPLDTVNIDLSSFEQIRIG